MSNAHGANLGPFQPPGTRIALTWTRDLDITNIGLHEKTNLAMVGSAYRENSGAERYVTRFMKKWQEM
jgi:hypothetical protein